MDYIKFQECGEWLTCFRNLVVPSGPQQRLYEQILRQTAEGVILRQMFPRTAVSITFQASQLKLSNHPK